MLIQKKNNDGGSIPIIWVQSIEILRLLLDHGADINKRDTEGYGCILGILISNNDFQNDADSMKQLLKTIEYAIDMGADLKKPTNDGETPLNLCNKEGLLSRNNRFTKRKMSRFYDYEEEHSFLIGLFLKTSYTSVKKRINIFTLNLIFLVIDD